MLALYRSLLALRRSHVALMAGEIVDVTATGTVLSYKRRSGDQEIQILLNLGTDDQNWTAAKGRELLSTDVVRDPRFVDGEILVRSNEGIMVLLDT